MACLRIIYASCVLDETTRKALLEYDIRCVGQQVQKYHSLLVRGFVLNGYEVVCISQHKYLMNVGLNANDTIKHDNVDYEYITTKNNSIKSYLKAICASFCKIRKEIKKRDCDFVVCDVLNASVSLGAVLSARIRKKKVLGIITDIPGAIYGHRDFSLASLASKWAMKLCTSYLLMSEQMKECVSLKKKSFVLEGQVDVELSSDIIEKSNNNKRICLYAGSLDVENGIKNLVDAFIIANMDNTELHIYGAGNYENELRKCNKKNVVYFGVKQNKEVFLAEKNATLLINPRPSCYEFSKYSFPSKNMEYMVSGTPLLTTNLPGMPLEYKKFVYLFDDETSKGMAKTLKKILNQEDDVLFLKGKLAREFVLKEKNNVVQAKKIIDFMRE